MATEDKIVEEIYKVIPEDMIPEQKYIYEISNLGNLRRHSVSKRNPGRYIYLAKKLQSSGSNKKMSYNVAGFVYHISCGKCEKCKNAKDVIVKRSTVKTVPHPLEDKDQFRTKTDTKCKDSKKKGMQYRIHVLVANMFVERVEGKPIIDHIDGNRSNNVVSNIRWASYADNASNRKGRKNIYIRGGRYQVRMESKGTIVDKLFIDRIEAITFRNKTDVELNGGFSIEIPYDIELTVLARTGLATARRGDQTIDS